ncbi:MAG: hypothetical protein AB1668_06745 [Nanoarchaeota archaeon]
MRPGYLLTPPLMIARLECYQSPAFLLPRYAGFLFFAAAVTF